MKIGPRRAASGNAAVDSVSTASQPKKGVGTRMVQALRGSREPSPEQLWLDVAVRKLESASIDAKGLRRFVEGFPVSDRPLVMEILRQTGHFGHHVGWAQCLDSAPSAFDRRSGAPCTNDPATQLLVLDSGSTSAALKYHLGKQEQNSFQFRSRPLPTATALPRANGTPRPCLLLDAASSRPLTENELDVLASIPQLGVTDHVYLDIAPTYLEFLSPDHFQAKVKVEAILEQCRTQTGPSLKETVERALDRHLSENLSALNARRQSLGRDPVVRVHNPSVEAEHPEDLAPLYAGPPLDATELQAKLKAMSMDNPVRFCFLASEHGLSYHSPKRMLSELRILKDSIEETLQQSGRSIDEAFLISAKDGQSEDLLNWMFCSGIGSPEERWITPEEASRLAENRKLSSQNALLFLNDLNGSGATVARRLNELNSEARDQVGQFVFAHLVQQTSWREQVMDNGQQGSDRSNALKEALPKCSFLSVTEESESLSSPEHPFIRALPPHLQAQVGRSMNDAAYGRQVGIHLFFLSRPDNSSRDVNSFASAVLGIRDRAGASSEWTQEPPKPTE